ncbi:hypothetical protein DFH27DRAFT_120979 [Peziza echinospora]|nr:hypothetical protein DFH27DRAFT_120979 [Peziza echinospora]
MSGHEDMDDIRSSSPGDDEGDSQYETEGNSSSAPPPLPTSSQPARPIIEATERLQRSEKFDFVLAGTGYDTGNELKQNPEPGFLQNYDDDGHHTGDIFARYYDLDTSDDYDTAQVPAATLLSETSTRELLRKLINNNDRYSGRVHAIELEDGTNENEAEVLKDIIFPPGQAISDPDEGNPPLNSFGLSFTGVRRQKNAEEIKKNNKIHGYSRLSFRFPYISLQLREAVNSSNESPNAKSLSGFINEKFGVNTTKAKLTNEFSVERARFTIFNDDIILVARTGKSSRKGAGADLICPHQKRLWGFHYLMTMIGSTLGFHDRAMLSILRDKVAKHELKALLDPEEDAAETTNDKKEEQQKYIKDQKNDTLQLKYLEIVVDMQVNLLRNLRTFLQSANPNLTREEWTNNAHSLNLRKIPVVSDVGGSETMAPVLAIVDKLVEERMEVKDALEGLRRRIMKLERVTEKSKSDKILQMQQSVFNDLLQSKDEQRLASKVIADEISFQGKQISIFTVINAIFLPLNFFTAYFSAEGNTRNGWVGDRLDRFWMITTPISTLVLLVALYYMFKGWYSWREIKRLILDIFRRPLKFRGLIKRTDLNEHAKLLASSRKFHIKVVLVPEVSSNSDPALSPSPIPSHSGSVQDSQSKAKGSYYLTVPREVLHGTRNRPELKVTQNSGEKGVFSLMKTFDGHFRLFIGQQDRYGFMYEAICSLDKAKKTKTIVWKCMRKAIEQEPYLFHGEFRRRGDPTNPERDELVFKWMHKGKPQTPDPASNQGTRRVSKATITYDNAQILEDDPKKLPWDTPIEELENCDFYYNKDGKDLPDIMLKSPFGEKPQVGQRCQLIIEDYSDPEPLAYEEV